MSLKQIFIKLILAKQCIERETFYQGVYSIKNHAKLLADDQARSFLDAIHSKYDICKTSCRDLHLFKFEKDQ